MIDQKEEMAPLFALAHMYLIDEDRLNRWIKASFALGKVEPFFVPTFQSLGRLDSRLVFFDKIIIKNLMKGDKGDFDFNAYTVEHLSQATLWLFGAYEIVRVLNDKKFKKKPEMATYKKYQPEINALKLKLARIRMPLAKFEPADKHKGDAHVPTPSFNITHGVAWQITESEWIIRKELSDEMLELLEKILEETKTE
ncbi:TPA: hypothetical protein OMQ61_001140 [Acinetobacter baumannii]|uniref:hypothetical protein n=1 Tax=Acinetobacter baumannii TaxID=470 RepID=UPI00101FDBDC|nr:hypothetical protein [Acinetobacter baumannii]MDC4683907.1 hypothetical protein [Acinetobacter baumannii]MDR9625253.1 hypothetical protein [Acinetobacter baumannii]HCJ0464165.1 hypothetical protein [Acinetobacter baumannii]HCQ9866750.1 hypothetical protein [Acinetobacter baumannii]